MEISYQDKEKSNGEVNSTQEDNKEPSGERAAVVGRWGSQQRVFSAADAAAFPTRIRCLRPNGALNLIKK